MQVTITGVFEDTPIVQMFDTPGELVKFMLSEQKQYLERGLTVTVTETGMKIRGTWIDYEYKADLRK